LEKEDIDMIKLKSTRTIEINEFIELKDFDPIFVEKSYYIGPDVGKKKVESTANAYSLFVKVLLLVLLSLSVIPQTFFTFHILMFKF
jgi:DNA end-binding protein Ku